MSGMFDTKTDKTKRKQETALKEEISRKKSRRRNIIIITVFLLIFVAALLLNSNLLRRTLAVVTIDGVSFTTADFEYFFNSEYMNIEAAAREEGWEYMLPNPNRPLSSQIYNSATGETWADIITNSTLIRLRDMVAVYNDALEKGFQISRDSLDSIDSEIMMYELYAGMYNVSVNNYLQQMYGSGMNVNILRKMLEFSYLIDDYVIHIRDSFSYTTEDIDKYYAENADTLDIFKFRMFIITPEVPEDIEEDEAESAREEAMKEALALAESYIADIETEVDFINTAGKYDGPKYGDDSKTLYEYVTGSYLNSGSFDPEVASWLCDTGRAESDTTIIEVSQGAAIIYFIEREDNSYKTASMRQVLFLWDKISADDYDDGEDDPEYKKAIEEAAEKVREKAEMVEGLFIDAGADEDALLDLMEEYSDDTTEGGFYDNIAKYPYDGVTVNTMKVVPELEDWLFDIDRSIGDYKLIKSEQHGYHLMYFPGYGELFSRIIAEDQMRIEDSNKWLDDLNYGEPVKHASFILVTT